MFFMKAGTICTFATEVIVPDPRKLLDKYFRKEKIEEGREEGRTGGREGGKQERGRKEGERMIPIYGNSMTLFRDFFEPNFQ